MTATVSKKKSLRVSLYNFWYFTRISLFILLFVLGIATTLCVLGLHKNVHMMRCSLALFLGSGLYLLYLLFIFVFMLTKIRKQKESEEMSLKVLENGELQFRYGNIDSIVDRTKIKWVREHKSRISFFISLNQFGQLGIFLDEPVEADLKAFILSCKDNKKIKLPVIYIFIYLIIVLLTGSFSATKTIYQIDTVNKEIYDPSQKYQFKDMLNDLCPQGLVDKTPISQRYYYYKENGAFSINPPTVGLITFVYTKENYDFVKTHLQSTFPKSEWMKNYKGTTFYIHPRFTEGNSYGFIGYNNLENRIIFLGYEEGYVSYGNPIESDFEKFVSQIYGRIYPNN